MGKNRIGFIIGAKDAASKTLKNISSGFGSMGAAAISANQGLELARKGFQALERVITSTIKPMAEFQQEMANISTLIDVNVSQFDKLGSGILDIAKTSPKAISDLTAGMYDLLSAGVPVEDSLWALSKAQKAAVAGSGDIKTAVAGSMATINAYNLEIADMEKVFDLQFNTVRFGVITFEQLASSIGRVLPSGKQLGANLEEVHAGMALITKAGFSADEAATVLSRTLTTLASPTTQENLNDLGIIMYDQEGQFLGMVDVIKQVEEATKDMTDLQRTEFYGMLGLQDRAAKGFITLIDKVDEYGELIDKMSDLDAMETAYEKMTKTILNRWETIRNKIRVVLIEWVQNHEDVITKVLASIELVLGRIPEIETGFKHVFKGVYQAGDLVFNLLTIAVNGFLMGVVGTVNMLATLADQIPFVGNTFKGMIEASEFAMNELTENIKKDWEDILNASGGLWESIEGGIESTEGLESILYEIKSIFDSTYQTIQESNDELDETPGKVKEVEKAAGNVDDKVKDILDTAEWLETKTGKITKLIAGPMTSSVGQMVDGLWEGKRAFESMDKWASQMLKQLVAMVAQAAAFAAIMALVSGGGFGSFFGKFLGFHKGGVIPKAHSGLYNQDELLILAQRGEAVLSRQATSAIGGKPAIDYINKYNQFPYGGGATQAGRSFPASQPVTVNFYGDVINEQKMIENIEKAVEAGQSNISISRQVTDVEY